MKKLLLSIATLLAVATTPAVAQVDYQSHPHYPSYASNVRVFAYGRISARNGYVNGRQGPGTGYRIISYFYPGDSVEVGKRMRGSDGYDWYLVASDRDQVGWIRGDYLHLY